MQFIPKWNELKVIAICDSVSAKKSHLQVAKFRGFSAFRDQKHKKSKRAPKKSPLASNNYKL